MQRVITHFLMKDRSYGSRSRGHDPHPIGGTTISGALLVFVVLHKGLGRRMMIHDGDVLDLKDIESVSVLTLVAIKKISKNGYTVIYLKTVKNS